MSSLSYTIIFENYDEYIIDLLEDKYDIVKNIFVLNDINIPEETRIGRRFKNNDNNIAYIQYIMNNTNTDYYILIPKNIYIRDDNFINKIDMFFNSYNEYNILVLNSNDYVLAKNTYKDYFNGILAIDKNTLINIPLTYIEDDLDINYLSFLLYKNNYKTYLIKEDNIEKDISKCNDKIDCTGYTLILPFKNNYNILEKLIWNINEQYNNLNIIIIDNMSNTRLYDINTIINEFDNIQYFRVNKYYDEIYSIESGIDLVKTKYVIFFETYYLNTNDIQMVINMDECSIYNNIIKINKSLYNSILRSDGLEYNMNVKFILMKVDKLINQDFDVNKFISTYNVDENTKKIIYKYIYDL